VRPWRLDIALDAEQESPLYRQITNAIVHDIRRGRLRRGDALPGSRALAEHLGVSRKTIVTALNDLADQGWIVTSSARGTRVSDSIPEVAVTARSTPALPSFDGAPGYDFAQVPSLVAPRPLPKGTLNFDDGSADPRLAPLDALATFFRTATRSLRREGLVYSDPRGDVRLRDALATHLNQARGLAVTRDEILVTRGSQMAITLVAQVLVQPGDAVAVEDPGYGPARAAFQLAGAVLKPVETDGQGLSVEALERLLAHHKIRAIYVTPQHHYPTTVSMAAGRRAGLLALAVQHRFAVIEDDYDYEFHFGPRPPLSLASVDGGRSVLYVGSLSKLLAPAVRVGYLVGPASVIERAAQVRMSIDRQGDIILERAIAELLEEGLLQGHARKARSAYLERRDVLVSELSSRLGATLDVVAPTGGLALWATPRGPLDLDAWAARAEAKGVRIGGDDGDSTRQGGFRMGYASLTPAEIRTGVERLAAALPDKVR
jgi:GntR family transcriptional regulator/MocR family aminotransferase